MNKTLKAIVLMSILTIILSIANISNAFSYDASLSKSTNKLEAGSEVKVTLKLSNIDMDDGIQSIKIGKVVVGDAFEAISQSNFSGVNGWSSTYNSSTGSLSINTGNKVKDSGEVVVLTLKVKSGNTTTSSTVKFENIIASSGINTGDIKIDERHVTIGAEDGNNNNPSTPVTNNTPATSSNKNTTATNSNKNTAKNAISSSKTTSKKLPKAGDVASIVVISVVSIIAIVAIVNFIRYSKNKDIK